MEKKTNLIFSMTSKDIHEKIEEYLPVRNEEKNKYGEVFTPLSLINEIMDKLDKKIWKNPNLKWLDPASGIGNFPMVIFERLNEGLKPIILNEIERKKHIVENMLYMVEINEKNVSISKKIFGINANIFCGSFLEDKWKNKFGVEKFDFIVGNPPFNKEKKEKQIGTKAKNTLWDIFIIKSLDNLKYNGYLCFINPPNWRGVSPNYRELWNQMSNKQLLYLHIYGVNDGRQFFNVNSRFDLYILHNTTNTKQTEVIDELGKKHYFRLNKMHFLPNYAFDEINKILIKNEKGVDVIMSYNKYFAYKNNINMSKIKTNEFKYPIVHTITNDGIGFWYSNTNKKGHFGVPKVILNFNVKQYSYKEQNDYKGKYGMSQISFGIPIKSKKEGDLILKAIETPIFKKIIASTKWGAFQTDHRMFNYFRKDWYKILLRIHKKTRKQISKTPRTIKKKSVTPKTRKKSKNKKH